MNTRVFLSFATVLLLTGAIAPTAGDPVQVTSEQAETTPCNRGECMQECQRDGGTLSECSERCRTVTGSGRTGSSYRCMRECRRDGTPRHVCDVRCSRSDDEAPSKPEFPSPGQPKPTPTPGT
jgi:hypothetical protein